MEILTFGLPAILSAREIQAPNVAVRPIRLAKCKIAAAGLPRIVSEQTTPTREIA
jgi:hypothetical protein